ncbi:MAG: YbaY family lipoprotein [Armatimonadetes bacterium]|nr:YbaY family lipoprotein [Armatimonadota bacterium]
MVFCALALLLSSPKLTWVKVDEEKVRARYFQFESPSAQEGAFNKALKGACLEEIQNFRNRTLPGASFDLSTLLSSCKSPVTSALVTVTVKDQDGPVVRRRALTFGKVGSEIRQLTLKDVLRPEIDPSTFVLGVVLPAVNAARRKASLPDLATLPVAMFDQFVPTTGNLAWPLPAGISEIAPSLFKMPWTVVASHLDPAGAFKEYAIAGKVVIPLSGMVTWVSREALPYGSRLEIRLLRDREDSLDQAVATQYIVGSSPPIPFDVVFPVPPIPEDERFYLDLRITFEGKTYYRNRAAVRVPVEGWQTRHEIQLDVERDPGL